MKSTILDKEEKRQEQMIQSIPPAKHHQSSITIPTLPPFTSFEAIKTQMKPSKNQVQTKISGTCPNVEAAHALDVKVADFIHSNSLPFCLASDAKFIAMIKAACHVSYSYVPLARREIGGMLLENSYMEQI